MDTIMTNGKLTDQPYIPDPLETEKKNMLFMFRMSDSVYSPWIFMYNSLMVESIGQLLLV